MRITLDNPATVRRLSAGIPTSPDWPSATFDNVINIRTFLTDMDRVGDYVAVRSKYFTGPPPTSTTVEVSRLAVPGALIEIEVVAAC